MKMVLGVLPVLAMRELPEAQVEHIYSSSLRCLVSTSQCLVGLSQLLLLGYSHH